MWIEPRMITRPKRGITCFVTGQGFLNGTAAQSDCHGCVT